ncbi:S41 family peptidase [Sporosarcina sp. HYO08]|uniref:lmo1851 family serine protease n=1 Tax=Sporosarcina sp. HYO08 TaxID=1759557 RepID=UPI0007911FA3|nr:S41 family peptidase [Sporosarcina sp. HYO08]KXH81781.1 peptidase S41 [Sporosarcina sp. HYO08]
MEEKENMSREQGNEPKHQPPAKRYIRLKPFSFLMLVFGLVLVSAGITFFVLTTGEDKVVEVVSPQKPLERKEFQKLYDAYDELKTNYYDEIDEKAIIDGAINGMIDALGDPYSDYLNEQEAERLIESISSSFEGIGAEIQEWNGYIKVVSPIKKSPAEKAGLLPNDIITAVDGKSIQGLSSSEAVLLIRGEKGSTVTLSIRRGESPETFDVKIVRDVIPLETVYPEMLENGIAHIHITNFADSTYEELLTAIHEMSAEGMKGLILDVRQNPGGTLNAALAISDLFVEKGKNLFQYVGKDGKPNIYTAEDGEKLTLPVAVVIDDGSASASEIVAAALKESANIPLIGLKTFGKGTVQTPMDLSDGSNLKLTTAKWLTPNGNWIHKQGIAPDIEVPYPPYAMLPYLDPSVELKEGMLSPQVKVAEDMLTATGYDAGEIDGLYDAQTKKAVQALQVDLSVEVTGILSEETTFGLLDKLRTKIQEEDPQLMKAKEVLLEKIQQ